MTDAHFETLQADLGSAYLVERELGRGGMATVYLVRDTKHGREVALKVLLPHLAASLGPERFRREIAFAARLQHPHILSIHDSGETPSGQLWFTMPFVEGETLRARLQREGQLPVADALRIAREVADALEYAHQHGVVHRDIKPENILLAQSHALVADFGVARALTARESDTLTETGLAIGTPQYMSPEQASAERQLDGRTDIYSLGAVLFEMLAGEPPFTGPTAQSIIAKMLSGEAPSIRRSRPSVSEEVDAVVRTALAPVPADRFPTAGAFAQALDGVERTVTAATSAGSSLRASRPARSRRVPLAFATLVLGLLLGGGALFAWRQHVGRADDGRMTIAVLPFESIGDSADAYFADGMTDAVRDKLAALPGLSVIATASTGAYRKSTKGLQEIGRELGVRYLVVGKVRWAKTPGAAGPSRVQVRPQLVEVESEAEKWGQPFDAPLTDVFAVQSDIAERVAEQLRVTLTPTAHASLASKPTANLDAYDSYLRGWKRYTNGTTLNDANAAAADFEQAVALDSNFALAWAALARARAGICLCGPPKAGDGDAAHRAALRALAIQPLLPEAHVALGDYYYLVHYDMAHAIGEYHEGLRIAPNNPLLMGRVAMIEQHLGHFDSALVLLQRAARLDPTDVEILGPLELTYQVLHRWDDAQALYERRHMQNPNSVVPLFGLASLAMKSGDTAKARALLASRPAGMDSTAFAVEAAERVNGWLLGSADRARLRALTPADLGADTAEWGLDLALEHWSSGDRARARVYADSAERVYRTQIATASDRAFLHSGHGYTLAVLGRPAEAIAEGQRATAMFPIDKDHWYGPEYESELAEIYAILGQQNPAMDHLERVMLHSNALTPASLRANPLLTSLHGNPRFERLAAGN